MDERPLSMDDVRGFCRLRLCIDDYNLENAELEERCPLDNGKHVILAKTSVGQLDLLPLELINEVLQMLDILTLTTFRSVNQRAMLLVDSLPPYRRLWTSCPSVLRAAVSIYAASFSCATLFQELSREKCASCSLFGGYLYLISCRRVCYICFTTRKEYFPVSLTVAARQARLPRKAMMDLPQVLSLPGRYTELAKPCRNSVTLIDRSALLPMLSEEATEVVNNIVDQRFTEPRRFMAIIEAPRLYGHEQEADWGLHCNICRRGRGPQKTCFRTQYSRQDILQHFQDHHASEVYKMIADGEFGLHWA